MSLKPDSHGRESDSKTQFTRDRRKIKCIFRFFCNFLCLSGGSVRKGRDSVHASLGAAAPPRNARLRSFFFLYREARTAGGREGGIALPVIRGRSDRSNRTDWTDRSDRANRKEYRFHLSYPSYLHGSASTCAESKPPAELVVCTAPRRR